MAWMTKRDYNSSYAEFTIADESELSKLPLGDRNGTDELSTVSPIRAGSAYTTDGTMAIYLYDDKTNSWVLS